MMARRFHLLSILLLAALLPACGGASHTTTPGTSADAPAPADTRLDRDTRLPLPALEEPMITAGMTLSDLDGLRIVHKRTPGNSVVAAGLFFTGGATFWRPGTIGDEHMALQSVVTNGPASMSRNDFHAAIDRRGASVSASSGREFASLAAVALVEDFEDIWSLLVDALLDPDFSDDSTDLVRRRQVSRIQSELDDPDRAVSLLARRAFFHGTNEALSPLGTLDTVHAIGESTLGLALDALLVRERATLVVVGDVDELLVQRAARAVLDSGALPSRPPAPEIEPRLPTTAPALHVHERPGLPTTWVLAWFDAPAPDHPDFAALSVATRILSDRFFEEIRTRRNLAYAVSAGVSSLRSNVGWLYVTSTDPEQAFGAMRDTIDELVAGDVSERDVQEQIEIALTELYMGVQTNNAQASILARWNAITGDPRWADAHLERFRRVTAADVQRVTADWIRDFHITVIATPETAATLDLNGR